MNTQKERLKQIRDHLESEYYMQRSPFSERPLPECSSELQYRIDSALNMQPESHVIYDTQEYIRELNKTLFRLRYRELYKAISAIFVKIADQLARLRDWAYNKAIQWGRI